MSLHREKIKENQPSQGISKPLVRDSHWYVANTLIRLIVIFITFIIFILSFLSFNNVSAAGGSMTVTISDTTVDLNVSPSTNGTFAKSDATTIGVSTTNATGYTLSISANSSSSSNPTSLVNNTDNTKMFPSIQSAITEDQFKALDGGTAYNNMWGYLPSKYCVSSNNSNSNNGISNNSLNCSTNTNFLPSPTTNGDILDITSTANTTINEYELTVGARVDTTATLGTYSNVFLVEAVANAVPYTVTYKDNVVINMPIDTYGTSDLDKVTISNEIPIRNGYTFLGWCKGTADSSNITNNSNGNDTCSTTVYNPNGTGTNLDVPIDQTASVNDIVLYAMWGNNYTIESLTYLQDFAGSQDKKSKIISTMQAETNYTLKDRRDNQDYTIAKLKDGNIWMTKNLNIAGGTTLTSEYSDVAANYTLPNSSTTGFDDNTKAFVYNSNRDDISYCSSSPGCYSYYSWLAATAGTGVNVTVQNTDAPFSICPKGWKLPTSRDTINGNSDFYQLAVAYGMNPAVVGENASPVYNNAGPNTIPNFFPVGWYAESSLRRIGDTGPHWSSTTRDNTNAWSFDLYSSGGVNTAGTSQRRNGFPVRCILK